MSHVAEMPDFCCDDLDNLERAAKALGLELVRGQTTYRWYGTFVGDAPLPAGVKQSDLGKCDHAIRIPPRRPTVAEIMSGEAEQRYREQAYEVGVVARPDGTYALLWDYFAGGFGLQELVGRDGIKLRNEYDAQTTVAWALEQGYQVERTERQDGTLDLDLTVLAYA